MIKVHFVSLGFKPAAGQEQVIQPGPYTLLRFPYGTQENADPWDMHPRLQPGGTVATFTDPESGLIYPAASGIGCLELNVIWMDGDYTELKDVFVRDPLGTPDETAYDHRPRTPGEQCFTKTHWLLVQRGRPLGVQVAHDGATPAKVRMAQFKLAIFQPDKIHPVERPARKRATADRYGPDMV